MVRHANLVAALLFTLANHALSQCPDVPANGCSICGDGQCVGNPDAILTAPTDLVGFACWQLQQAGYDAQIPLDECSTLIAFISDCECTSSSPTIPAPVGTPTTPAPVGIPTTPEPIADITAPVALNDAPVVESPITLPPESEIPIVPTTTLVPVIPTTTPIIFATQMPVLFLPGVSTQPAVDSPNSSPEVTPTALESEPDGKGKKDGKKGKGKNKGGKKNKDKKDGKKNKDGKGGKEKKGKKEGKKNKGKKKESVETSSPVSSITLTPTPVSNTDDVLPPPTTDIPFTSAPITSSPQGTNAPILLETESPVTAEPPVNPPTVPVQPAPINPPTVPVQPGPINPPTAPVSQAPV